MRIQTLLHAALVLIIFVLCGKIVATWRRPMPSVPVDASASPSSPSAAEVFPPTLTQEGTDAFVATIAQNDLFSSDRGAVPAPVPVETQKKVDPPSHLKLVGVLLTTRRAEAFLSDSSQGNKVVRIKQGDNIGQYQLLQVMPIEVKLSLGVGGEVAPLRLQILDSATAQQAPRLVPQVTPQNLGVAGRQGPTAGRGAPGPPPDPTAGRGVPPPPPDPNQPAAQAAPEEAQALRDNIQRMQQRLRRIRRRAAREEAATRGENGGGDNEENNENDDEE